MTGHSTLVVTGNPDFKASIVSTLGNAEKEALFVSSVKECLNPIQDSKNSISCVVVEIPEDLAEFESSLRFLKREECAKYLPCIGVLTDRSCDQPFSRQLFFHVLSMPLHDDMLPHTIEAARSDYKRYSSLLAEVNSRTSAIGLIKSGKFRLQTLSQAEALTTMLSLACPEPAVVALGLSELLVNAIEHGNLQISYDEKSKLLENGEWDQEIQKRLGQEEYKDKFVEILFERNGSQIDIVVKDQGDGFDWRNHIDNDPSNHSSKHGRGIAIAIAMGFSKLSYNEKGNEVTASVMV